MSTLRRQLADLLAAGERDFEDLQERLELTARELEEELRHVQRSATRSGAKLIVTPARCIACGFTFTERIARHLRPPGRCPKCRSERILPTQLRLVEPGQQIRGSSSP